MTSDIPYFLKNNIEPIENSPYGKGFRAAATLKDGTFLPCVIFRNPAAIVNLAIKRFEEEKSARSVFKRSSGLGYWDIVKNFVTSGNCVNNYDIANVEKSRYALPPHLLKQIKGETTMSWTAFVARFKDGRALSFGTTWSTDFFNIPPDHDAEDIVDIINHAYLLKSGEIVFHDSFDRISRKDELEEIQREKPFFECFIDNL